MDKERLTSRLAAELKQYQRLRYHRNGGIGTVFSATYQGRKIAIKLYNNKKEAIARENLTRYVTFDRRILDHPGLTKIHRHGTARGMEYVAMEWAYGLELNRLITDKKVSWETIKRVIPEVLRTSIHLREHDIAHGDVAAKNIKGTKLIDYDFMGKSSKRHDNNIFTTPYYAAPEEVQGYKLPETDLFKICSVIYEMMFGKTPQVITAGTNKGYEILLAVRHGVKTDLPTPELAAEKEWAELFGTGLQRDYIKRAKAEKIEQLLLTAIEKETEAGTEIPYQRDSWEW